MKTTSEDMVAQAIADVYAGKTRFREHVSDNVLSYEKQRPASFEEVLDTITEQHGIIFGAPIAVLQQEVKNLHRAIEEKNEAAKNLRDQLAAALFPEFVQDCWHLPVGSWEKSVCLAIVLMVGGISCADFWLATGLIAPFVQDKILAACSLVPIVFLSFLEPIALRLCFGPAGRKRFLAGQSVCAVITGLAALWLTMRHGQIDTAAIFSGQIPGELGSDMVRTCFGLTCSLLTTGVMVEACIDLGNRSALKNPRYQERVEEIKSLSAEIDDLSRKCAKIEGTLEELEKLRESAAKHSWRQAQKIQREFDRYWTEIHKLAFEPFTAAVLAAFLLFLGTGDSLAATDADAARPLRVAVVVSPDLTNGASAIAAVVSKSIGHPGAGFQYFDGRSGAQIAEYKSPALRYPNEAAALARIAGPVHQLIAWATNATKLASSHYNGEIDTPKVLGRVAQACPELDWLILIGSPIYRSADANFDFTIPKLRYPGLGLLTNAASPFAPSASDIRASGNCKVIFVLTPEPGSERYERNLRRFWASFFKSRNTDLVAFTDLTAGLKIFDAEKFAVLDGLERTPFNLQARMLVDGEPNVLVLTPLATTNNVARADSKVPSPKTNSAGVSITPRAIAATNAPLKIAEAPAQVSTATVADPKQMPTQTNSALVAVRGTVPSLTNSQPQSKLVLPDVRQKPKPGVTITVRYKSDSGIADLYAKPFPNADEVSFKNGNTAQGNYSYQFDQSTGRHEKSVYFPAGIDPTKGVVWLNFTGTGRLAGVVIWSTPEGDRELPFSFPTFEGGDSSFKREVSRRKSLCWFRVDLYGFVAAKPDAGIARPEGAISKPSSGYGATNVNTFN